MREPSSSTLPLSPSQTEPGFSAGCTSTSERAKGEGGFYESVHLLRGGASLLVFFAHYFGWYPLFLLAPLFLLLSSHGQIGVSIFFVISGFVLPLSLKNNYVLSDFPRFMLKRAVRIEPTYAFSVLLAIALLLIKTRIAPNATPYQFNILEFLAHFFYLIPFTHYRWYNEVYWTLAIEFQFYVLIALIFPLLRRNLAVCLAVLFGFASLCLLRETVPQAALLAKSPLFAIGMAGYLFTASIQAGDRIIYLLCMVVFAGIYASYAEVGHALAALLSVLLIIFWKPGKTRWRYFGDISYSLYVTHYPILFLINQTARHYLGTGGNPLLFVASFVGVLASWLTAHLVFKFIEEPTQKWSKKIKYRRVQQSP